MRKDNPRRGIGQTDAHTSSASLVTALLHTLSPKPPGDHIDNEPAWQSLFRERATDSAHNSDLI